jgi:predicted RNA-binding Zn-ribbon protein involved in translation (DUF1610 family)
MDYWLISDADASEVVKALEDGRRHASTEAKRAYFEGVLHTLHSGLHTTDAVPSDFLPVVTAHVSPNMAPETAQAFGQMVALAVEMVKPRCPKCGSWDAIPPVAAWPSYTCEPCGNDFTWSPARTARQEGGDE